MAQLTPAAYRQAVATYRDILRQIQQVGMKLATTNPGIQAQLKKLRDQLTKMETETPHHDA
jgi:hypothetical protein